MPGAGELSRNISRSLTETLTYNADEADGLTRSSTTGTSTPLIEQEIGLTASNTTTKNGTSLSIIFI